MYMRVFVRVIFIAYLLYFIIKIKLHSVRSNILSNVQAVCDTPIARITGCVSSFKDIGRRLPLQLQCSYQGQQGGVRQSVRGKYYTRF